MRLKRAIQAHREWLWESSREGRKEWGNVTKHCLVVAARVEVLADWLNLPKDIKDAVMIAAAIHDAGKKVEVEMVRSSGCTWEAFEEANQEFRRRMINAGFSEIVIELAGSVGHASLLEMRQLLAKGSGFTSEELARLVIHYVDDITVGDQWVEQAEGGKNQLDIRMQKNKANKRYEQLDRDGEARFDGQSTFDVQAEVGKAVEKVLAQLLGYDEPIKLPELIDAEILARARSWQRRRKSEER